MGKSRAGDGRVESSETDVAVHEGPVDGTEVGGKQIQPALRHIPIGIVPFQPLPSQFFAVLKGVLVSDVHVSRNDEGGEGERLQILSRLTKFELMGVAVARQIAAVQEQVGVDR